jgi:hypothetical protein
MADVEVTDQFTTWYRGLDDADRRTVNGRIEMLETHGAGLGRPTVDTIKTSEFPNMKELRGGSIRILFAFDPRRTAIMLLGGDKRNNWTGWYLTAVPEADQLYRDHLLTVKVEGEI